MLAANSDIFFKRELVKALSRLKGDWDNQEAAGVIQPVLLDYSLPSYIVDVSIMEEVGIIDRRHIYVSLQKRLSPVEAKDYRISFLAQPNAISGALIPYLQLLDIILLLQRRDEPQYRSAITGVKRAIISLTYNEQKLLLQLARKYPAAVRACLGFLWAGINQLTLSSKALQTLNPAILSRYKRSMAGINELPPIYNR